MRARFPFRWARRASILVVVMVTILFATFALIAFMERASNDLLVDQREVLTRRLRLEAYSALETTLAVLERFREVNNGLRSPGEGWHDPLEFAGYAPAEGRVVRISFEDESGKISLPRVNAQVLQNLFKNWGISEPDAEAMADAMMGWMNKAHVYSTSVTPDYEQSEIPFETPGRPLRSYHELAAIEKVRDVLYDEDGRPTDLWRRFADSVSLLNFQRPNINGAKPDTLAAVGLFEKSQQDSIRDYVRGTGAYEAQGPGFFQSPADAQRVVVGGGNAGDLSGFSSTISALRIIVTVIEGRTEYRLAAVVAPPGGATTVQTNATLQRQRASADAKNADRANQPTPAPRTNPTPAPGANQGGNNRNLRYPFTLLEMRENDEIPAPPPPPAESPF